MVKAKTLGELNTQAHFIAGSIRMKDQDNPRRIGEGIFFSRHAVKRAPNDTEVQRIRTEILAQIESIPKP